MFDVSDIRTTRLQLETVLDRGGIQREGPPPSPPPGLWRKRTPKRRSPSLVFSQSERGIYPCTVIVEIIMTFVSPPLGTALMCVLVSNPDFPAEGKRRCPLQCQSPVRPGISLQTQRPSLPTCSSAGRALQM